MEILAVLTNDGREYEIDQIIAGNPISLPNFKVGKGGEDYVPTPGQTALNDEIAIEFTDIIITKTSQTIIQISCHLPLVAGFEETISEVGVFTDTGKLFAYGVFNPEPKLNSNQADFIFPIQL